MKAIMYHYVRKKDSNLPYLRYLDFDNFRKQLDFFQETDRFLSKEEFFESIRMNKIPKDGILLTFDDGLIDHYNFVFKELKSRGLWGFFFISTQPYKDDALLNVHRIHSLLGQTEGIELYNKISPILLNNDITFSNTFYRDANLYSRQQNDAFVSEVKKILNYYLSIENQSKVLSLLDGDDKYKAQSYYLSLAQIKEMSEQGMIIGSHGENHRLMMNLSYDEQHKELKDSFDFLEKLLQTGFSRSYAHPYGGKLSFNTDTVQILNKLHCPFAFMVNPKDFAKEDYENLNKQALPRYDCNQFPFGQAS